MGVLKQKVIIITLSYNKPQFVAQAIRSVLGQTYKDFEYLIIENSTDKKTKKVVKSFKDKRIHYFEERLGKKEREKLYVPAYLLNKYYKKARGEYLIFLADDDLLLPRCLSVMVRFLDTHKEAKVCFHDQAILYSFDKKFFLEPLVRGFTKVLKYPKNNPKDLLDGGQVMFKKSLLSKISYPYLPTSLKTANLCDKIFLEKLWQVSPFYPVKQVLSVHRVVSTSTHRQKNPFRYYLYYWGTKLIPVPVQSFFGKLSGKRREISKEEKRKLKEELNAIIG